MNVSMPIATPSTPSPQDRPSHDDATRGALADPELRRYLERYVRRRLPNADADDVVQSVLCAALEAKRVPEDRVELRMWITGVARRKIAALHRGAAREQVGDVPEIEASPAPIEASSLARWAEQQAATSNAVPERAHETLEWMEREGEGESLEHIADEARLPAPCVRQRVSRMRRWMRARWAAELAAVATLLLLALAIAAWWLLGGRRAETAKDTPRPDGARSIVGPGPAPAPRPTEGVAPPVPSTSVAPTPSVTSIPTTSKIEPPSSSKTTTVKPTSTSAPHPKAFKAFTGTPAPAPTIKGTGTGAGMGK